MNKKQRARKRRGNPGSSDSLSTLFELVCGVLAEMESIETIKVVEVSIPQDMFRKLLMLCHPDKHNNSELSNEVTRWLVSQRG